MSQPPGNVSFTGHSAVAFDPSLYTDSVNHLTCLLFAGKYMLTKAELAKHL